MARVIKETRVISANDDVPETIDERPVNIVARVVYVIATLIIVLLALRFILALLGANRGNPFVDFIYVTSLPFVSPFFGMFNFKATYGVSTFEIETLFAIVVYAIIAWAIIYVVGLEDNTTVRRR